MGATLGALGTLCARAVPGLCQDSTRAVPGQYQGSVSAQPGWGSEDVHGKLKGVIYQCWSPEAQGLSGTKKFHPSQWGFELPLFFFWGVFFGCVVSL